MICSKCGKESEAPQYYRGLCKSCYLEKHGPHKPLSPNKDWIARAKEQGISLWLQQPGETQWEHTIWIAYRDSYPGKRATYQEVADQLGTTRSAVKNTASRWNFAARMQAWIVECERITLLQRRNEILDMNKQHIEMAAAVRKKLQVAIDNIDPMKLKPNEVVNLAKMSTSLEKDARLHTVEQEDLRRDLYFDNAALKRPQMKKDDFKEIVDILIQAGALGDVAQIGVAVVDNEGQSAAIMLEDEK